MGTAASPSRKLSLARAADEFVLTTVLLFLAVTVVRWLRDPGSALYIADLNVALAVIGTVSAAILSGLILSPLGKRSGGHMNPAVTVALWAMGAFAGRKVAPYVVAQLAGSAAGTGLARLLWGPAVSLHQVAYGAIKPSPTWQPASVFLAETGGMLGVIVVVGFLMARPGLTRLVPYAIGLSVGLVIALLGPLSGGSISPARQFGPAALSGQTVDMWIYLTAPILGAVAGASIYRLFIRRVHARRPLIHAAPLTRSASSPETAGPSGSARLTPSCQPNLLVRQTPDHQGPPGRTAAASYVGEHVTILLPLSPANARPEPDRVEKGRFPCMS